MIEGTFGGQGVSVCRSDISLVLVDALHSSKCLGAAVNMTATPLRLAGFGDQDCREQAGGWLSNLFRAWRYHETSIQDKQACLST